MKSCSKIVLALNCGQMLLTSRQRRLFSLHSYLIPLPFLKMNFMVSSSLICNLLSIAVFCFKLVMFERFHVRSFSANRPFVYSAKEPGSSVIFIHFYTRGSFKLR